MEQILIITGGSKGIGRGIIEAYLAKGVRVFSIARSVDAELSAKGVTQISFDLTKTEQVEQQLGAIFELLNADEIVKITLVNNAGTLGEIAPLEKLEAKVIEQVFKLNTVVPYICSAAFVRLTREISAEKSILNISSGAALKPYYGWSTYCGSKAALNMLTQNLALEQQDLTNGVKVLAIAPGVVDTDMQAQIRKSDKDDFKEVERFVALKADGGLNNAAAVGESIYQMDQDKTIASGSILRVEGK
ncbi:SDR family NAD(P)-dependent oxidoreductase [Pedobacter chitinilyticus]|uniref:SDR family NAD(P)-dependent oxidoreductase n=1 Tax=Pedobacter chitinilyticus TaxID=2233776 RepID=A0A443YRU4_9SPHI|nr:SDR family NAD(P)-dependent oxidoreductase [Pedobacter chitinilyticus]RWU06507.1 SDR family NAD(P)-dependent oxidoreductase [Pedobacter chitinilyticus]